MHAEQNDRLRLNARLLRELGTKEAGKKASESQELCADSTLKKGRAAAYVDGLVYDEVARDLPVPGVRVAAYLPDLLRLLLKSSRFFSKQKRFIAEKRHSCNNSEPHLAFLLEEQPVLKPASQLRHLPRSDYAGVPQIAADDVNGIFSVSCRRDICSASSQSPDNSRGETSVGEISA